MVSKLIIRRENKRQLELAKAKELSCIITKATKKAGITNEELEQKAFEAITALRGEKIPPLTHLTYKVKRDTGNGGPV